MEGLEHRVLAAREDRTAMDALLRDYLPFLRQQAARGVDALDYDDRLSLSMVAFATAARRYEADRGSFLAFAEICIRNRLSDEGRRARRYGQQVVELREEDYILPDPCDQAAERDALSGEITRLSTALGEVGITFPVLAQCSPRQVRARRQCLALAACVAADEDLRTEFCRTHRLPQGELARRFTISPKTVEKHRRYIAALAVVLLGDYPGIRAFLPKGEEAEL